MADTLLAWRDADRQDRPLLQQFACTTRPRKGADRRYLPHPKPWEREVEAGIRRLTPPLGRGQSFKIGLEGPDGIGSVAWVSHLEGGRTAKLVAVAVAERHRGHEGRHADEAMEMALSLAADYGFSREHEVVTAVGLVDPANYASKRMNQRAGMAHVEDRNGLEVWARDLELPRGMGRIHEV